MYVAVCLYVYVCVHTCTFVSLYVHVSGHICIDVCIHVCTYVHMCPIYVHTCLHVYICVPYMSPRVPTCTYMSHTCPHMYTRAPYVHIHVPDMSHTCPIHVPTCPIYAKYPCPRVLPPRARACPRVHMRVAARTRARAGPPPPARPRPRRGRSRTRGPEVPPAGRGEPSLEPLPSMPLTPAGSAVLPGSRSPAASPAARRCAGRGLHLPSSPARRPAPTPLPRLSPPHRAAAILRAG